MKYLLVLFSVTFLLASCGKDTTTETVGNIQRVFMHESNHYSFLCADEKDSNELKQLSLGNVVSVRIFADVSEEENMWIRYTVVRSFNHSTEVFMDLHLHSAQEINGAGWNHGNNKGETVVVE